MTQTGGECAFVEDAGGEDFDWYSGGRVASVKDSVSTPPRERKRTCGPVVSTTLCVGSL